MNGEVPYWAPHFQVFVFTPPFKESGRDITHAESLAQRPDETRFARCIGLALLDASNGLADLLRIPNPPWMQSTIDGTPARFELGLYDEERWSGALIHDANVSADSSAYRRDATRPFVAHEPPSPL